MDIGPYRPGFTLSDGLTFDRLAKRGQIPGTEHP